MIELIALTIPALGGFVSGVICTIEWHSEHQDLLRERLRRTEIDLAVARAQIRQLTGDTSWD